MKTERKNAADEQIDKEINAALRAVRNAEVPAGLSQRIASRMKEDAKEFSSAEKKTFHWKWLPAIEGAIAAALLLALGWHLTLGLHDRPRAAAVHHVGPPRTVVVAQNVAPANVAEPVKTIEAAPKRTVKVRRRSRHYELISYPLTHQERLLVQLARTVDPKEVQMLNPEYRAAQDAKEEAEFVASAAAKDISNASQASSMAATVSQSNNEFTEEGTL